MRFRTRAHFARNLTLIVLAGAVAGLAASSRVGPFAGLGVTRHTVAATLPEPQLRADQFFPVPTTPPAIKQVVEVQDPPRQVRGPAPTGEPTGPISLPSEITPQPTARPTATPTPSLTACFEGDCGGSDDGGGVSGGDGGDGGGGGN
jgi:hypothetical protein